MPWIEISSQSHPNNLLLLLFMNKTHTHGEVNSIREEAAVFRGKKKTEREEAAEATGRRWRRFTS
jgi:hypothetical protein